MRRSFRVPRLVSALGGTTLLGLGLAGCPGEGPSGPGNGNPPPPPSQNQNPTAQISSPASGANFAQGATVTFEGSATDPEDGALSGNSLAWQSNLDGQIGTGTTFTRNDLTPGQHTITLTATDSDNGRGTATRQFTVEAIPLPDLDAGPISFNPAAPDATQTVTILGSISNAGTASTGGPVSWRMTVDGIEVASGQEPEIAAGATVDAVGATDAGPFTSGVRAVELSVDPAGTILESNEDNNTSTGVLNVLPPPSPEFQIETLTNEPLSIAEGQAITIVSDVLNNGAIPSAVASTYRIMVDDQVAATGQLPPLDAGETFEIRETIGTFAPAAYSVVIELDINDDVTEFDEDNNIAAIGLAVTGSAFDIELRFVRPATPPQTRAFTEAANRWREFITGDLPDEFVNFTPGPNDTFCPAVNQTLDDLLISADLSRIDGPGNVLGRAGPCLLRDDTLLPLAGAMQFDVQDLDALETQGLLDAVILHEMAHVLGLGTLWDDLGFLIGPCGGTGACNPQYNGPEAVAAYQSIGGTTGLVPVANTGGLGTRNGHWREAIFTNELMTGFINQGFNPISVVTSAQFIDLGYEVDTNPSDAFNLSVRPSTGGAGGGGFGFSLGDDIYRGPVYVVRAGAVIPLLTPGR